METNISGQSTSEEVDRGLQWLNRRITSSNIDRLNAVFDRLSSQITVVIHSIKKLSEKFRSFKRSELVKRTIDSSYSTSFRQKGFFEHQFSTQGTRKLFYLLLVYDFSSTNPFKVLRNFNPHFRLLHGQFPVLN